MLTRALTLAAGLTGAAMLSQFPEYSQQYTQRLGGAVDELHRVVADFDASAQAVGLTREAALDEMRGGEFLDRRRADMTRTISRAERLKADLVLLRDADAFTRARHVFRFTDPDVSRATFDAYKPALPLTDEGLIFAAIGYLMGSVVLGGLLSMLAALFRQPRSA